MEGAQLACSINMEALTTILDWLGQQSAVIVALVGFLTAIVVAKITSGLELKKMLCLKRVDAYEAARCQLMRMTNTYENILACMAAINQDKDNTTISEKILLLLTWFIQLERVLQQDGDLARIALYATELPRQDARELIGEEPRFVKVVRNIAEKLQRTSSIEERDVLENDIKHEINRIAPLIQRELKHLYNLDDKLKKDIQTDKRLKILLG